MSVDIQTDVGAVEKTVEGGRVCVRVCFCFAVGGRGVLPLSLVGQAYISGAPTDLGDACVCARLRTGVAFFADCSLASSLRSAQWWRQVGVCVGVWLCCVWSGCAPI